MSWKNILATTCFGLYDAREPPNLSILSRDSFHLYIFFVLVEKKNLLKKVKQNSPWNDSQKKTPLEITIKILWESDKIS